MEWTKEKPTRPGAYWLLDAWRKDSKGSVVHVDVDDHTKKLVVWHAGVEMEQFLEDISPNAEWAGPIPEPSEPMSLKQLAEAVGVTGQGVDASKIFREGGEQVYRRVLQAEIETIEYYVIAGETIPANEIHRGQ